MSVEKVDSSQNLNETNEWMDEIRTWNVDEYKEFVLR